MQPIMPVAASVLAVKDLNNSVDFYKNQPGRDIPDDKYSNILNSGRTNMSAVHYLRFMWHTTASSKPGFVYRYTRALFFKRFVLYIYGYSVY